MNMVHICNVGARRTALVNLWGTCGVRDPEKRANDFEQLPRLRFSTWDAENRTIICIFSGHRWVLVPTLAPHNVKCRPSARLQVHPLK